MMSGSVVNASYAHAPQGAAPIAHAAWPSPSSGHHAETRHTGTADAAQRAGRAGLRERNRPEPTRGVARTTPRNLAASRGRGAGEAAAHLACESVLEGFRQRKLRCRYFATRGGPAARSLRWPRKCVPKLRSNLRPKFCGKKEKGDRQTTRLGQWSNYRQQFRATSKAPVKLKLRAQAYSVN